MGATIESPTMTSATITQSVNINSFCRRSATAFFMLALA